MNDREATLRRRPPPATLIAGALIIAGLVLTSLSWWALLLCAAGAFGPGILRELGWLRDKDEFQLRAIYRAGYHAYLASGLMAVLLVAFFRSGERSIDDPEELATLFLALLGFTWLLSSLIGYWGAQKAAARLLLGFGGVWLAFAVVSNLGSEWTGWAALLLHPLLATPFFVLAWLSGRWPRIAGGLLLVASVGFGTLFGVFRGNHLALVNQAVVMVLFIGPLLASGIALLGMSDGEGEEPPLGVEEGRPRPGAHRVNSAS